MVNIFFLYINENNDLYSIKQIKEENINILTQERQLFLIKNYNKNLICKHKIIDIFYFNFDISANEVQDLLDNNINKNFINQLKLLEDIKFNTTLDVFKNLNSVYYLFKMNTNANNNNTKKIFLTSKNKTRKIN